MNNYIYIFYILILELLVSGEISLFLRNSNGEQEDEQDEDESEEEELDNLEDEIDVFLWVKVGEVVVDSDMSRVSLLMVLYLHWFFIYYFLNFRSIN